MKIKHRVRAHPESRPGSSGRALRRLALVTGVVTLAGLVSTPAFAAGASVTAATGGTSMTAANAGPTATFTNLTNPKVTESVGGQVSTGRFQLNVPTGFEFRTSSNVTMTLSAGSQSKRNDVSLASDCSNASHGPLSITPTATSITFYVCSVSTDNTTFTYSGIGVRPTANNPVASGDLYLDNGSGVVTITGVTTGATGTSFGSLVQSAGSATHLSVSMPATTVAGTAKTVTVTARDAYENTAPSYRGAIKFTSSDPSATLPADYTFVAGDNGVHTFTNGVTLKTAGSRSVTATDKSTGSINGVASVSVTAAAASTMSLAGIANPATAGASTSATVTLRDAYNNVATGYTGTVHFTSTDTAATLPADYTFTSGTGADNGTHTFTGVVLRTPGNQGVTATDGTRSATQSPITVQPGTLHHLVLSPASATITAGASRTFTAQGQDSSDNNLGDMTSTTTFTISPNGSCTANSCTATTAGAHTVTGTKSGATGTASLQVNPGAPLVTVTLTPATIAADGSATSTVSVHVADSYGNARAGDTVTLATDGNATLGAVHDNGDGSYTATATAGTVAGTQTITATDGAASGSAVLTETAGPPAHITLVVSPSTIEADGTSTAGATITVSDAQGNPRTADPVTLVSDGDVTISSVVDQGFGTYTATVTASHSGGTETLTAADGAVSTTAQLVELTPVTVTSVSPDSRGQGANGGPWGQSITVTGTGFLPGSLADFGPGVTVKFTSYVDAAHLTAHVVVAPDAAVGTRTVTVTVPDSRSAQCADCFTVTAGPTVADVTPNQIGPGAQKTVTITGANFATGVKVTVPASGVAVTSVSLVDSGHLTVGLSTAGAAAPGPRDLLVSNPSDGGATTCAGCLTVTQPPVVTAVSPGALGGGALATVTVTGANFVDGARLSFAGTGVAVISQSRVDDSHLTAVLSVAGAATPDTRTVSVINPDGGRGACSTCFTVHAAPTVTGITPATLARGSTTQVTVTGTNFVTGAALSLSTGVTVTDVTVVDAGTITATVSVSATTGTGNRTVLVTNPDYGKGTCAGCAKVS